MPATAVGEISLTTPVARRPGRAVKVTLATGAPRVISPMRSSGMPTETSGVAAALSTMTGLPAAMFSLTSASTVATRPAAGA